MALLRTQVVALLVVLCSAIALAQVMPAEARLDALQSTVQLTPYDWESDQYVGGSGSGTVISALGHLLTNYHVILDTQGVPQELLPVWTTDAKAPTEAAQFSYVAFVIEAHEALDLALLQIVADTNGNVLPAGYPFTFAPIGTIENLQLGDSVFVIGFPGVSGDTITYTGGVVSGFLGQDLRGSGNAWVKTDARMAPGNSGGGAFDAQGTLVGVPTLLLPGSIAGQNQELFRPINYAYDMITRNVPMEALQVGPRAPAQAAATTGSVGSAAASGAVSVGGVLGLGDARYFPGRSAQAFTFTVPRGGRVQVDVHSTEFDPYLIVLAPSGEVWFEVDDSDGAGLNVSETASVPAPGTYTAIVTSAMPGEAGSFRFRVAGIDDVGSLDVGTTAVPTAVVVRDVPNYSGHWSGRLIDTAGGRAAVVATLTQIGNAVVEGTWEATFAWGTTKGTLVGLIQSEGLFVEMYPDDQNACPFSGLAELVGLTIAGAYTAFDCSVPIAGSLSMTLRD